ncbi:MAG: hypothetical protein V4500_06310 [Pseudomonadota bacterium]
MSQPTAFHQLGRFIFLFQHIEAALTELLVLLARADDETTRILVNELEYGKRVTTTDVMFAWFAELGPESAKTAKADFHKIMVELIELGKRRNDIIHSKYSRWINVEGVDGLIRQNSKLRTSKGKVIRELDEEELLPEAFEADCNRMSLSLMQMEDFRMKIIAWLDPE